MTQNLPTDPRPGSSEPLLLVPTERHVELELGASEERASTPQRILTWSGFIAETLADLAPDVRLASPHATRLAAREALDHVRPARGSGADETAARISLSHALDGAIGRLRRAGVGPAHLRELDAPQASLLAGVMEEVDATLQRARLVDPRGVGGVLARRLQARPTASGGARAQRERLARAMPPPPFPPGATVTGIAAWEADDLALVEALHARMRASGGPGVTVMLPRLGERDDAMSPIADMLERRWAALTDSPELDWQPTGTPAPTEVIRAKSAEAEARAVASACLAALARGTPPEGIAIVLPDLSDAALEPLRAALADAHIPFCEPAGRAITACPEGRAALLLLEIAAGPVTREKVIDLLRAPGFAADWWTEAAEDKSAVGRAATLAYRLREVPVEVDRTGRLLIEGLAALVNQRPEDAWMTHGLERFLARARWLGESAPIAEVARRFVALLKHTGLGKPPMRDLGAALRSEARGGTGLALRAMADGAVAVRAIADLARSIAATQAAVGRPDRPSSAGELFLEIQRAAAGVGVAPKGSSARAGAVRIASPAELCGIAHELLIVTGLSAHAYSGAATTDDTLIDERLRTELPVPLRPASAREREAFRRAELAWAIAGARSLTLSFAPGDESDLSAPHPLIVWAIGQGARSHEEPASRIARGASRLNRRAAELIALARGAQPEPGIEERARIERERAAFFLDPRSAAGVFSGRVIVSDEAQRLELRARVGGAAAEHPIAVTQIERAAECAFAGFARRVLRVRRFEDLVESADARERGTLVHKALHAAFEALREEGHNQDPARLLAVARAAAEQALEASRPMAPLRREAVERAIADALGVALRSIEAGDPVRFALAERRFGAGEPPPWQSLELAGDDDEPGPSVFVDGQIDRLDRSSDGRIARVIDYKSSLPTAASRKRGAFQLPLYAAVALRALGAEEVHRAYVAVRKRGEIDEWPRDPAEQRLSLADISASAREARRVVLGLWEGNIEPRPMRANLCDRCDARDVCRRPAVMPVEDAEEDA